jgi:hypothetical protein
MTERKDKLRELEQNVQKALEDLADLSSKHDPDSDQVRNAKEQRFAAEKALVDFRGPIQENAESTS